MSLKSLEAALRRFPEVDIPETLEAELLAQIPRQGVEIGATPRHRHYWGFWSFGGAVAAAVVLSLILASVYLPNSASNHPSYPTSANYARADQNTADVQDINASYFEQR